MLKSKNKFVKQVMAFAIAVCMLVTALPSAVLTAEAADTLELLEPMSLGSAIMDPPGAVDFSARSTVNGRDYLFIPIRGKLMLVYDLDAYKADPTNDDAVNVDVEETGINVPRGIIEEDGYMYVVGSAPHIYKYNPVTKTGEKIDLGGFTGNQYLTLWGIANDEEGNLYIAAQTHGILKYNTKTGEISTFWNKVETGTSNSLNRTLVYDNGYIYSCDEGVIRKLDLDGKVVKEADVTAHTISYFSYLSVEDGIVFGGGSGVNGLIALDVENMEPVDIGVNEYALGGIVSPMGPNGKYYGVTNGNGMWEYDPVTKTAEMVNPNFNIGLKNRQSFIEVNGRDYLLTNAGGKALCQLVDLETYEVISWGDLTDNAGSGKTIRSLTSMPGRSELYIGGYQTSSVCGYDTLTRKFMQGVGGLFQNPLSQVDAMDASDEKLYLGCYRGGYLTEYDPDTNTMKNLVTCMENTFNNYSINDIDVADNKVFFTCGSGYGNFGAVIGWYDLSNGRLYVVTGYGHMDDGTYEEKVFWTDQPLVGATGDASKEEAIWTDEDGKKWKPTELRELAYVDELMNFIPNSDGYTSFAVSGGDALRGAVYHQDVINVEYHEGYLYCTTTRYGGYGTKFEDDRATDEAKLMIYNVNELKKEGEFFVRAGSENVIGGIEDLTTPDFIAGVQADPNGKLWGLVSETLFSFSYNPETKQVTITEELSFGKTDYAYEGNKQKYPRHILFDDQGYMYVGFDTTAAGIRRIKLSDPSVNQRLTGTASRLYTLGNDGNFYYSNTYTLMKVALTEVAKVEQLISAIDVVTLDSGEAINKARVAYGALSARDKEEVYNYAKLQAAEVEYAALDRDYNAEVSVDYRFDNNVISTDLYTRDGYGSVRIVATNYVDTLNAAYDAGTINNVYFDHEATSGAKPYMHKFEDTKESRGIYYWSVVGEWLALKIKSPGSGEFDLSLDYEKSSNNTKEASVYILPGDTTNVAEAFAAAEVQAKVDVKIGSGTVSLGKATFEKDKDYIIVFNPTMNNGGTTTKARMYLSGLTMTTKVDTLENAQAMATTNFHKVTLLHDTAAALVKSNIDSIGTVTLESKDAIEDARAAYEALLDPQKALVSNLYILEEAEAKLATLNNAEVDAAVSSINAIGTVTLGSEGKIKAARAAYEAVPEDKRASVTNYQTLVDAETEYAALKAAVRGYIAGISAVSEVVDKGEKVSIQVTVEHQADVGQTAETGFHAGEISFTYDSSKLTFNKEESTLGEAIVNADVAGELKLADYGEAKSFGSDVYVLVFDTIEEGEAAVELTSAAFINKANAVSADLAPATLGQTDVAVDIQVAYAVTLPEGFTGNSIVRGGESYTFEALDTNYDYTLRAAAGGKAVAITDNGDGSYTIAHVDGDLVVNIKTKKGKTFDVAYEGTGKDDMTGAATATYGTDYSFTLPTEDGSLYGVDGITINGNAYTGYSVDGKTYTIPGSAITGKVVITVTKESVPVTNVTVAVEGSGAGAAAGFTTTAVKNKAYTLTISPEAGYSYQVTATMGGTAVANMTVEGNAYTIPNVTSNIVFTITASVITDGVSVAEYLTLDGTKIWLVKNTTKTAAGKVPTYNGNNMLWSEEYDAYCYLVVAEDLQTDAAKNYLGIKEGTLVNVDYGMDVNKTGKVDASDAQLVYDMYNAAYANFDSNVTMEKFLSADVTVDQKIDLNDAVAIVANVLGIASN